MTMNWSSAASVLALALIGLPATVPGAAAEGYADRIDVMPNKLYVKDGHGRAVVTVTNKSGDTLDIDVACTFSMGERKVGVGSTSISRLPPRGSEVLDIADRQTQPLDSVHCDVTRAQK
jgi:hypothetical protein